jgi:hypothetical protein
MRRRLKAISILCFAVIGLAAVLPPIYRWYVNRRFAADMTSEFGQSGWAIVGMGADHQGGQQLHLYRTLYVRFLNPRWISYTPWKKLTFTHKTSCVVRPWHYWINVVAKDREITYYWSMRNNEWVSMWDSPLSRYWPAKREDVARQLAGIRREHGMNYAPDTKF